MGYNPQKVTACLQTADNLLQANNTVTTLEIKKALHNDSGTNWMYWDQTIVHGIMDEALQQGKYKVVQDNGTYRTYASVTLPSTLQKRGRGRPRKSTTIKVGGAISATNFPGNVVTNVVTVKRGRGRPRKNASAPTVTPIPAAAAPAKAAKAGYKYISRTKALQLMENNHGHFFTATFTKKDGSERTMNCQYLKDQSASKLGYIKVKEPAALKRGETAIKQVNLQTLKAVSIAKVSYKIR